MKFEDLNLKPQILRALKDMFGEDARPTEVQERAIPPAMEGKNVIAQAKTGSGKTLAFCIPIMNKLEPRDKPQVLVLVPTRELAKQVAEVFRALTKYMKNAKILTVYGGVSIDKQINGLRKGANIIVATPGRLIDLYERKVIDLSGIEYVVLDEADRMLDMGFFPDIQYILDKIPGKPQFLLFSATILYDIIELSRKFTGGHYESINVSEDSLTVDTTRQYYYLIQDFKDKYRVFLRILAREKPSKALVFTNTKKTAEWLANRLSRERSAGLRVGMLSGSMSQAAREKILRKFKSGEINLLIATDVAARGLDIPEVSHVFNYDIPQYEENYVHRIGRTGRMGKKGVAITLCLEKEYIYLCRIESFINRSIKRKPIPSGSRKGHRDRDFGDEGMGSYSEYRRRLPFF